VTVASNLPPGCSVSDIPGNRPEDARHEAFGEQELEYAAAALRMYQRGPKWDALKAAWRVIDPEADSWLGDIEADYDKECTREREIEAQLAEEASKGGV
jgi:hypothetical protein